MFATAHRNLLPYWYCCKHHYAGEPYGLSLFYCFYSVNSRLKFLFSYIRELQLKVNVLKETIKA